MSDKWIDRMATPKRDPAHVDNISELLMDTSKINMSMDLLTSLCSLIDFLIYTW